MDRIVQSIVMIVFLSIVGCSDDNSTCPSDSTGNVTSSILGTWYNTENETDTITFYPDGFYEFSKSSFWGTYSYLESEKKGYLTRSTSPEFISSNFYIVDNILYLDDETYHK